MAPPEPPAWEKWRPRLLRGFAAGVAVTMTGAFIESFTGLIGYAARHGLHGLMAVLAPTMVDTFIIGGEALALLAVMEGWDKRARRAGLAAVAGGLAVSVAGNVGRDGWNSPVADMAVYAIAPVAMTVMAGLGLIIVKRRLGHGRDDGNAVPGVPEDAIAALVYFRTHAELGTLPSVREIKETVGCGQGRAGRIRAYLEWFTEAFAPPGEQSRPDGRPGDRVPGRTRLYPVTDRDRNEGPER
jgi:Protein of unknown function (DUF2637)